MNRVIDALFAMRALRRTAPTSRELRWYLCDLCGEHGWTMSVVQQTLLNGLAFGVLEREQDIEATWSVEDRWYVAGHARSAPQLEAGNAE